MATGDLGATDIFSPGTGWNIQSSTVTRSEDIVDVLDGDGDVVCQPNFNEENVASAEYQLCGEAGTISLTLGAVTNGYIVRSIELSHEAGQAPNLTVEGIAYDGGESLTNRTSVISVTGLSVAALSGSELAVSGSGEATSVTRRWEMELVTAPGGDGNVAYVAPRTPMETYEESGVGSLDLVTTLPTLTNYVLESAENSDSNQEMDTYSLSFKRGLNTTVV